MSCATEEERLNVAKSEDLLLTMYSIQLPDVQPAYCTDDLLDCVVDNTSVKILEKFHPVMLSTHNPIFVHGDGNCMYRAASMGAFKASSHHALLQLKTTIELILSPSHYDSTREDYVDVIADDRLVIDSYAEIVKRALSLGAGGSACMRTIAATSSVLGFPIQMYCPPSNAVHFLTEPLTKRVLGRGVRPTFEPCSHLMWAQMHVPHVPRDFGPDHFALLCKRKDLDANEPYLVVDDVDSNDKSRQKSPN